jgi:metal-responsive CopG/Arc/MetJ family transcriptional regulator
MKRTQVYLPNELHEKLRRISYEQHKSMAQLVREAVSAYVGETQVSAPAVGDGDGDGDGYGEVKIIAEPQALSEEDLTPEQLEELKQNPLYHIIGMVSPSHLSDVSEHRDD